MNIEHAQTKSSVEVAVPKILNTNEWVFIYSLVSREANKF